MHPPTRILVVEDEVDIGQLIKHTLERSGDMRVDLVASGDAALKAIGIEAVDASDVQKPDTWNNEEHRYVAVSE